MTDEQLDTILREAAPNAMQFLVNTTLDPTLNRKVRVDALMLVADPKRPRATRRAFIEALIDAIDRRAGAGRA